MASLLLHLVSGFQISILCDAEKSRRRRKKRGILFGFSEVPEAKMTLFVRLCSPYRLINLPDFRIKFKFPVQPVLTFIVFAVILP